MKKIWLNILIVILSLFICALFAGCGEVSGDIPNGSSNSTNEGDDNTNVTLEESEGLSFELIYYGLEYEVSGIGTCTDTEIVIPAMYNNKPVTSIGECAFARCESLTDVKIPSSVTDIGFSAFRDCLALKNIVIPDSVTSIGECAFEFCKSLITIEIPRSVTNIGDGVFASCERLTTITVNSENEYYCDIDGVLFNKDKSVLKIYPLGKKQTTYTIPNSVTTISDYAFCECNITRVIIPDSVTRIGDYVFSSYSLTSVVIPDSVTSIGNAFYSSRNLTRVDYTGTIDQWVEIDFEVGYGVCSNPLYHAKHLYINNQEVTQVNLTSATKIGNYAFRNCIGITSVAIGDCVTSIGESAFDGCSSLTSVVIPDSVTSIGGYAFVNCSSLTSVVIPDSVISIGGCAFVNCSSLTSVVIPDSVTSIDYDAFNGCSSLTSVVIGDSVTSIGENAFRGCSSLTSVVIPDSVISIGERAFYGCSSLTSVVIGNSVTSIDYDAFYGCNCLSSVYYKGTKEDKAKISVVDFYSYLTNATWYYYSETQPTDTTEKYWHYVDGVVTVW